MTSYRAALDYLFARTTGNTKFGLERTAGLLQALGDPHHSYPVLHVAGTNGKGSVVATLDAVLRDRGLRVGRYTSPHLVDFRERIVVNGETIAEEAVVEFVERWTPTAERLGATFFEVTTGLALAYFAERGVDVAVIETGLGGRLDSTNVVRPRVATVTSIGIDHTEYLGGTLDRIADEKAGVFKAGAVSVIGETDPVIAKQLADRAHAAGSSSVHVAPEELPVSDVDVRGDGTAFTVHDDRAAVRLHTPLVGRFQARNAATALLTLAHAGPGLAIAPAVAAPHLARVRLPGRFQRVGRFIFDVAHNPAGSRVLAETLSLVDVPRPTVLIFSVLADKDWRGMLAELAGVVDHAVLTIAPTSPPNRVWSPAEALDVARAMGLSAEVELDFDRTLARASEWASVLVTGSFHTVGDAMERLQVDPLAE